MLVLVLAQLVFQCVTGSYSIPSRGRFRVSVECENSTMEDSPGLAPVLPVQSMKNI